MTNILLTKYKYAGKPISDRFADLCLSPSRYFFQGRDIEIITRKDKNVRDKNVIPPGYEKFADDIPDPEPRIEVNGIKQSFSDTSKSWNKTIWLAVFFIPGLFAGAITKGMTYLCSSQLRKFTKLSSRYEFTYSMKKTVPKKLQFQLECARAHQHYQNQINLEPMDDKTFGIVSDIKTTKVNLESFPTLKAGLAETIGRRKTMEDAHLASSFSIEFGKTNHFIDLFGIFDGHGGQDAALYVRDWLQINLVSIFGRYNYQNNNQKLTQDIIADTLTEACVKLDIDFRKEEKECGTTATIALRIDNKIYTANVGDSRAIFVSDEVYSSDKIIQLTEDAKLNNPRFANAVKKAGGFIDNGRISGLESARDIGFTGRCLVSPRPKITCIDAKEGFLVLACDGLWDVLTTNEVGTKLLNDCDLASKAPQEIAQRLLTEALDYGSTDNISVMVVRI